MKYSICFFIAVGIYSISGNMQASPRTNYLLHCSGCHLPDGRGAPPLVPTLINEPGKLIRSAAGRDYLARVPGASQAPISDLELSEVLNYMLLQFSGETLEKNFRPLDEKEVHESRKRILADPLKFRDKLWQPYQ